MKETPIILCIDDEPTILNALKTQLRKHFEHKYVIETAESGEEALEIIEELIEEEIELPLVICDYIMPSMKGDEVLIKIHKQLPHTIKILLTGQVDIQAVANIINHCQTLGCKRFGFDRRRSRKKLFFAESNQRTTG